jgi:hypothetical protein
MRHALLLAAVAALSLGCGRPILSAEVEAERVSITTPPVAFPDLSALPPFAGGLDPSLFSTVVTLEYDVGVPTHDKGVTAEIALLDLAVHLHPSGPRPPDGLRSMELLIVDPNTAATTLVASYTKGAAPTPTDIALHVTRVDLQPYLADDKLSAHLQIAFDRATLPSAFQVATELGFSFKVTVDYMKL